MRKKVVLIILFIAILISLFFVWRKIKAYNNQVIGNDILAMQDTYIENMQTYATSMDDIVTLYVSGSMSQEDFLDNVDVLEAELTILYKEYTDDMQKANEKMKIGSSTYESQRGCEAVDTCFHTFQDVIDMLYDSYGDPVALSYKYIAYQQTFIEHMAEYSAAVQMSGKTQEGKEE